MIRTGLRNIPKFRGRLITVRYASCHCRLLKLFDVVLTVLLSIGTMKQKKS